MKPQTIGAVLFLLGGLTLLFGGGGYLYMKFKPIDPTVQAKEVLSDGRKLANVGNFPLAVDAFNTAIELDPDLIMAYRHRGAALLQLGDAFSAIRDLTVAITSGHDDAEIRLLRGRAREQVDDLEEAIADYTRVTELDPDNREVYQRIGRLLLNRGQYAQAAEHLREAVRRVPTAATAHRYLAWSYWGMNRYDDAIASFDLAIENDPYNLHGHFGRGVTNLFRGQLEAALPDLEDATHSNQQRTDYPHLFLFLVRMRLGMDVPARETLKAHQDDRSPAMNADWPGSLIEYLLGDMTEEELFVRITETGTVPDPRILVEGCYYAAMMNLHHGNRDRAIELFRRSFETQQRRYYEYHGAMAELRAMGLMEGFPNEPRP